MEINNLILRAQQGGADGKQAANELLFFIAEEYRERTLYPIFAKGTPYFDRDDLRQAFLMGCYEGILKAKLDVGNALDFILQKGRWEVADAIRSECTKGLRLHCADCSSVGRLNRVDGRYICRQCGSESNQLLPMVIPHSGLIDFASKIAFDHMVVQDFRSCLSGRKRDVFDLIMYGYDRDNCQNYLKEIGHLLGISAGNVNLRLRQIREAWNQYRSSPLATIL